MAENNLDDWLTKNLICPRDYNTLKQIENTLICPNGCKYPIIEGIPIMLLDGAPSTHKAYNETLETAKSYLFNEANYRDCHNKNIRHNTVDPYVQREIAGSCGNMYKPLINKLSRYPIPMLGLPYGEEKYFLDIGCNWGRWCISAVMIGYNAIGIDPSLEAIKAARRVAKQIGIKAIYLVADGRFLPFPKEEFDVVFSYSVLQHFDKKDVRQCLIEGSRTLKKNGICLIQMPNNFGLRNLYVQLKKGFKKPTGFNVRYWGYSELIKTFKKFVGPTSIFVDGFFSLNAQVADIDMLPFRYRLIVGCSEMLHHLSGKIKLLSYFADSWYVKSVKQGLKL